MNDLAMIAASEWVKAHGHMTPDVVGKGSAEAYGACIQELQAQEEARFLAESKKWAEIRAKEKAERDAAEALVKKPPFIDRPWWKFWS